MPDDDLPSQKDELTRALRARIRMARIRAGYATLEEAKRIVEIRLPVKGRTYAGYETGPNVPDLAIIHELETFFNVPMGWIATGDGRSAAELEAVLKEAESAIGRKAKRKEEDSGQKQGVNQLTSNLLQIDIKPSQFVPSGRIPVLLVHEIASFLASGGDYAMDPARMLTVPESVPVGPLVYCYVIPAGDFSMVAREGLSFAPGDELILDGALDVEHGGYLLIGPAGSGQWMLRRYEGGASFLQASEFMLYALNPAVSPVRVTDRAAWDYGGRLIRRLEKF